MTMPGTKDDERAIEDLHRRDMRAALSGDFETLRGLIDDEAIMFPPNQRAQRGGEQLDRAFEAMRAAPLTHEVLEYELDFEEVRICGDLAIEWGVIRGAARDIASGELSRSEYHVMRVLRRQANGSWKVYRSIWAPAGQQGSESRAMSATAESVTGATG